MDLAPHGLPYMDLDAWKTLAIAQKAPREVSLRKAFPNTPDVVKVQAEARRVLLTISTKSVDRDRDTVDQEQMNVEHYEANPVVLWAHQYSQLPLGTGELLRFPERTMSWDTFVERDIYPLADSVYRMMTLPIPALRMASIGFRPETWRLNEDRRGVDFERIELLEHSIVPIGSNREALAAAKSLLGAETMQPLITWCEEMLDTWHEGKGLWLPKVDIEQAWKVLAAQLTRSGGGEEHREGEEQGAGSREEEKEKTEASAEDEAPPAAESPGPVVCPHCQSPTAQDTGDAEDLENAADETPAPVSAVLEGEVVDDEDHVDVLVASLFAEDYHYTAPPDLLGMDPDTLRDVLADVVRDSVTEALKRSITAVTGRLID